MHDLTADNPHIMRPAMVTAAFCLEVYLKILIVIDSATYPSNEHNLRKLFNKLSIDRQCDLRRLYNTPTGPKHHGRRGDDHSGNEVTFDYVLDTSSNAFVQMRYWFEREKLAPHTGYVAGDLIECVRQLILSVRPNWQSAKSETSDLPPAPPSPEGAADH